MKTIVLTGGGTAGHVMPNIALIENLKKHYDNIVYIGTNGIEKTIAHQHGLKFFEITATKLVRKNIFKNLNLPFKFLSSINQCKKILKKLNPNVIFSKGGFVALPVVIAGKKLNIPVVSHESDLSFGLANKIILKYADVMITSFEKTANKCKKCQPLGSPIRKEIFKGNKANAFKEANFSQQRKTLLFFGGSLGAKALNEVVENGIEELTKLYNIIHITGKGQKNTIIKDGYYQMEFTTKIENFFALSDIVICRAGANSIFELLALKKPMILVPLPKKASRGDQIENANYFKEKGYATVIMQEELSTKKLLNTIKNVNELALIQNMEKAKVNNANESITEQILKISKK